MTPDHAAIGAANRRVVGLDLSLTATGWANSGGTGTITTKLKGCERLAFIREQVKLRVGDDYDWGGWVGDAPMGAVGHWPLVVLEGYSYASKNQAHQMGELGGVIRLALHEWRIPYVVAAPTARAKYATGKGNAGKEEVLAAAIRRLGYEGHDNNEADALWLRAMGLDALGAPLVKLPESHRVALGKVAWPS